MRRLFVVLLLLAVPLRAEDKPREIFPSDYTPSPCAPKVSCISFTDAEMQSAADKFLGLHLDPLWEAKHAPEIKAAIAPLCAKHATCMAHPLSSYMFCDDVLSLETRDVVCPKLFPKEKNAKDFEQCSMYIETYLIGIDTKAINPWKEAQACAKAQPPATHAKPLQIWMSPASLPYEYSGYVTFYALDPDMHVPVLANLAFEDQIIYDPANPAGNAATYYAMAIPPCKAPEPLKHDCFKYIRVPNKEGHTDAIAPLVTVTAAGYPTTTFRLDVPVPKAVVEMTPAEIHPGRNEITVTAKDSINGKPVEGRVMLGANEIGFTNQPITVEWKKGTKRPEIWLKPFMPRYGDVVLVRPGP